MGTALLLLESNLFKYMNIERKTHTLDAATLTLGRLASRVSHLLRGKHKSQYIPNIDNGDFVVVENAKNMKLTGKKAINKIYYHNSHYLGGLKKTPMSYLLANDPAKIIEMAVSDMLPPNRLKTAVMKRLDVKL
ncbi:MAG: large subunit ribosomal protein L13 [Parcubacteria group bacterium Gr01-1014_18]|nr:MAG: large subunit ribosomal protein L13 [Parcubacteria group bacterium Greene0416_36]TSC80137.1 MAG: large subunit ribosomal protein L13 [Parcubacteria group bacterium Gr01-1014_18]TSC99351.1 MAG: large subunit ribosomal protein L13 [Parcubacteria group bacterium Greene1014_20]TSD06812.1 MAG: large subunit ribosomal protein L13 [Parcubacteria group bacterium Greene0714_2]